MICYAIYYEPVCVDYICVSFISIKLLHYIHICCFNQICTPLGTVTMLPGKKLVCHCVWYKYWNINVHEWTAVEGNCSKREWARKPHLTAPPCSNNLQAWKKQMVWVTCRTDVFTQLFKLLHCQAAFLQTCNFVPYSFVE